eukprot:7181524-Heterocapsa_arctica.AAC.1
MSDASPGGHGRAWACFPTDLSSHVARLADSKAPYSCLSMEHGIEVDQQNRCPLKRIEMPSAPHWCEAAKP